MVCFSPPLSFPPPFVFSDFQLKDRTSSRESELEIRPAKPRPELRGPAAILFISRDTCSDSIAKLFRACFMGYRTIIARYVAKRVSHRCAFVKLSNNGGYRTIFGGVPTSLKKYRAIWGIAAIVSQYREIWGH